jgi:hypothetical protein
VPCAGKDLRDSAAVWMRLKIEGPNQCLSSWVRSRLGVVVRVSIDVRNLAGREAGPLVAFPVLLLAIL